MFKPFISSFGLSIFVEPISHKVVQVVGLTLTTDGLLQWTARMERRRPTDEFKRAPDAGLQRNIPGIRAYPYDVQALADGGRQSATPQQAIELMSQVDKAFGEWFCSSEAASAIHEAELRAAQTQLLQAEEAEKAAALEYQSAAKRLESSREWLTRVNGESKS